MSSTQSALPSTSTNDMKPVSPPPSFNKYPISDLLRRNVSIPPDFLCPLSFDIMTDPVIVASGQTFERASILEWFKMGNHICPVTHEPLEHTQMFPNMSLRGVIFAWCEANNIDLQKKAEAILPKRDSGSPSASLVPSPDMLKKFPGLAISRAGRNSRDFDESFALQSRTSSSDSQAAINYFRSISYQSMNTANSPHHYSAPFPKGSVSEDKPETYDGVTHLTEAFAYPPRKPSPASSPVNYSSFSVGGGIPKYGKSQSMSYMDSPRGAGCAKSTEPMAADTEALGRVSEMVATIAGQNDGAQVLETILTIRKLVKDKPANREQIASEPEALKQIVRLATEGSSPEILENAITGLLNIALTKTTHANLVQAGAVPAIISVLNRVSDGNLGRVNSTTLENAAASVFALSSSEEIKELFGSSGVVEALVKFLSDSGASMRGKKDACLALFTLASHNPNRLRIVQAGGVRAVVVLMKQFGSGLEEKGTAVLAHLVKVIEGRDAVQIEKAVSSHDESALMVLVELLECGTERCKEDSVGILLVMAEHAPTVCEEILEEGVIPTLVSLGQTGTPRARQKASKLLDLLRKYSSSKKQGKK